MLKNLVKRIIREMVWSAKKKTIIQVLAPRFRRDGTLTGLKAYGVKGHGPLGINEISFMANALTAEKGIYNDDDVKIPK